MSFYKQRLLVLTLMFSLAHSGSVNAFSLPPRLSVNAYASDYTIGEADLMLPMAGDRRHNFYVDPTVAYGTDNQGTADLGLGYRWIKKDAAIFGVYVFGGYTRLDNNARLWVANPGLEALGSRWDAHLNAYLPMGDRHLRVGNTHSFFAGHSEFADFSNLFAQYAGNGADVKLGYQLFPHTSIKGYVGSYFFSPAQTNNIWGGAAGLEYWPDTFIKVFASYTYDSLRHSTAAFGIGVELGGAHTTRINPTLEERMTDPVERNLAELGRGSAIPSRLTDTQRALQLLRNNIAFFSQTGGPNNGGLGLSLANCTFENPCGPIDFTNQGTSSLNNLLPNTTFAFEAGTFAATDVPGGTNPVTVRTGQSITSIGGTPATLVGGLILEGDNSVNRISLQPTASTATGPGITALAGNNQIIGTRIGSTAMPFATGLRTLDSSTMDISDSTIFASSVGIQNEDDAFTGITASRIEVDAGTNPGIGINSIGSSFTGLDSSVLTVRGGDNSIGIRSASSSPTILSTNSLVEVAGGANTIGIDYFGNGGLNLNTSVISATGSDNTKGIVVEAGSGNTVNLTDSSVLVDAGSAFSAIGVDVFTGSNSNIMINGSLIGVEDGGGAIGVNNLGNGALSLANSTVTVISGNATTGIINSSSSLMTIQDTTVNVTGGNSSVGIDYLGSGGLSLQNSSINITGADNSSGLVVEGSSSGVVSLESSPVTVSLGTATGGTGIDILPGSTSVVTAEGSPVRVTGGDDTIGINNLGSGAFTRFSRSAVTVIGGNNTIGILDSSTMPMEVGISSPINVSGGSDTIGINYLGSGGLILGISSINVTGGTNSSGIVVAGSSSGLVDLTSSPVTVSLGNATGGTGLNILTGSASTVTLNANQIMITGGNNTTGLNNSGNGSTSLTNGSVVTVTGGNNSIGLLDSSSTLMTVNNSSINVAGEASTVGIDYLGSGGISLQDSSINVTTGTTNSSGVRVAGSSSGLVELIRSPVTVNLGSATGGTGINILTGSASTVTLNDNSDISITGGDNTTGLNNLGNGTTSLTNGNSVSVMGGNNTIGILDSSSTQMAINNSFINVSGSSTTSGVLMQGNANALINNGSAIFVNGQTGFTYGVRTFGSSSVEIDSSTIRVTQSGSGTPIGMQAQDNSTIVNNGINLEVSANNTQALGMQTLGNNAFIDLNGSQASVSGDSSSLISSGLGVGSSASACALNGVQVQCTPF